MSEHSEGIYKNTMEFYNVSLLSFGRFRGVLDTNLPNRGYITFPRHMISYEGIRKV